MAPKRTPNLWVATLLVAALLAAACSSTTAEPAPQATFSTTTTTPATTAPTTASSTAALPTTTAPVATEAPSTGSSQVHAALDGTGASFTSYQVGDFTFDALVAGPVNGEPVILLHGFPSTNFQWRDQIAALSNAGYRVIAPNQRGYSPGARPPAVADYDLALLTQDVIDIAAAAGVDQFHLVGHDWGAAVAWMVGVTFPDHLLSLTAVSVPHPAAYTIARLDPDGEQSAKAGYIGVFQSEGFEDQIVADDASFLRGIYRDAGLTDDQMEPYLEVLATSDAAAAALNWYRANDLAGGEDIPAVRVPTLFVFSDNDCCLGRDAADLTVGFVDAPYTYEILEGVNHWVTETAADDLNALLLDHVAAYSSS